MGNHKTLIAPGPVFGGKVSFIASAFERQDVDRIYDRCIRPSLIQLGITPLRVDRVEHNDDIDNKILELLNQCDLCIADLTHARPSVYYEAGFVSGNDKPVIYVARKDHFTPRNGDPDGNLRVHFDLQMKNIIPWENADDGFSKRLLRRLRHVIRPMIKVRERNKKLLQERAQFEMLSLSNQFREIRQVANGILLKHGFTHPPLPRDGGVHHMENGHVRSNKTTWEEVWLTTELPTSDNAEGRIDGLCHYLSDKQTRKIRHVVLISSSQIPISAIRKRHKNLELLSSTSLRGIRKWEHPAMVEETYYHCFGGVRSKADFKTGFEDLIANLCKLYSTMA